MKHLIALVLVPDFQLLDMAGPASVFETAAEIAAERGAGPGYRVELVSEAGGPVHSSGGVTVLTRPWRELRPATLLVPGGTGARTAPVSPALCALLQRAQARGARLASVCTGAYVLAAAGVLDGRRVTTHWRHAAALQRRYPQLDVEADRIHLHDRGVWTSAGITAGIDLALAMVEADLGEAVARQAARDMVVYHRRSGGQSQFSALQDLTPGAGRMREVLHYIGEHLTQSLSIEQLAEVACISPRQFCRAFKAETGQTPAKAVERIRAQAARAQVEDGDAPIEAIARRVGFVDAERMRRAFVRVYGQPPQALRRAARAAPAEPADAALAA
ncbi:GlxA family transcriptional regulator [Bordetella genomosp. 1]|uniref:AraC family transcriptional regulator n=1 Tax=Bordetella genomosp. 1 TaxID=1395607 RepID=A0ABX4EUT8_9BORD|nr:GlxA family transcriptional regulator [Bordetella genomosp. 1]OZI58004.1 AraC family transcriptional regulator [Bordetella genomosp. 1]